jgi:hypothetical protein
MAWYLAILIAGTANMGFDPGLALELGGTSRHFDMRASVSSEAKHEAEWGHTYGARATGYVGNRFQLGLGAVYYGYESNFGSYEWRKDVYGPVATARYRGDFILELSYSHGYGDYAQNSYEFRFTQPITDYWTFVLNGGKVGDGTYMSAGAAIRL